MGRLLCVGDLNVDVTIAAGSPVAVGSDTAGSVALDGGGAAANVAAAFSQAGGTARFVGVVGDDLLGRFLVDELSEHGVEVWPVVRRGAKSRAIAALIAPGGDRSMVSDLATATVMRVDDVDPGWFADVDWLHLTAYSWFPVGGGAVVDRLVGLANERGVRWSVDPSSARMLADRSRNDALDAFRSASTLFPNHDEAAVLAGVDDPADAATRLLDLAETVVVTCGADGVVMARRAGAVLRLDAHATEVVNTLGAGDAFVGGFLASRLRGDHDAVCLESGLAAATRAVARPSAR